MTGKPGPWSAESLPAMFRLVFARLTRGNIRAPERDSLDISHNPELLRVADEDVAVVMPVADRPGRRGKRSVRLSR